MSTEMQEVITYVNALHEQLIDQRSALRVIQAKLRNATDPVSIEISKMINETLEPKST